MSMFPYDEASKPNLSVTSDTSTPEDKYPCQQKKVWYGGGSGGENPTSYAPGSGGSGYKCTNKTTYDQLLSDYTNLCDIADILTKNLVNAIEQNAELRKEIGNLYIKQGEAFIQDAKRIKEEALKDIKKLNDSINRNWSDNETDVSELTKPDPDHWSDSITKVSELTKPDIDQIMKNEFQNVLNTERVNLDPASITTKDYPKANYEVTAKN